MCSFITQHNATDVASFVTQLTIGMLTAGMSTRDVACESNVNFSTISRLQRRFREFGSTINRRPRVTTPAQDLHIQHLHLQDGLRPATLTAAATIGLHNQIIYAQTVRNRLREAHLHACRPHRGLDLTALRCRNRLEWANTHIWWCLALWRCSPHGWIPVFTIRGRWQTACKASCGWAVCWCQRCGSSGPWWWWGYGMGRRMLWKTNTGAFYWWHFECTEIPWRDPEAHCCAINPRTSPHVAAW